MKPIIEQKISMQVEPNNIELLADFIQHKIDYIQEGAFNEESLSRQLDALHTLMEYVNFKGSTFEAIEAPDGLSYIIVNHIILYEDADDSGYDNVYGVYVNVTISVMGVSVTNYVNVKSLHKMIKNKMNYE